MRVFNRHMKRQLLHAYRVFVPDLVKRYIPSSVKAAVLGLAYALTGYPDLRLWQMRHLYKSGPGRWLSRDVDDPLFSCTLQPAYGASEPAVTPPGQFFVEFGFLGLKVKGQLTDPEALAVGKVELRLDGQLLCCIGIIPSQNGHARILFTIRRPALELFPRQGRLWLQTMSGRRLLVDMRYFPSQAPAKEKFHEIDLGIPFGNGEIFNHIAATGHLDKKGWPRPTLAETQARQEQMLELYSRVREVFDQEFKRPLFLLYGTLLGQVRGNDFIPGDDDFDVGYVSEARTPAEIKAEACLIMEKLVARGFVVSLNHLGRPHRIRDASIGGVEIHLDNHIVFSLGDEHVWMHPRARLALSLDAFRSVETVLMRGVEVLIPVGAEDFLAAHYGSGWRIPDPGYVNLVTSPDRNVAQVLSKIYLTRSEQRSLSRRLSAQRLPGDFVAAALEPPYPLHRWAERVGF